MISTNYTLSNKKKRNKKQTNNKEGKKKPKIKILLIANVELNITDKNWNLSRSC